MYFALTELIPQLKVLQFIEVCSLSFILLSFFAH